MTIRTRFDLGQTPTGRFLELLQPPMGVGQRPMATTYTTSPQPAMRGDIPMRVRPQPQPQPIGLRGITGVTQPLPARPMTALERDIAMKMGLGQRKAPPPPTAKPSLMDRLTPAVGTPEFAGLSQAAATGLQLSGWQDRPVTLGQGLGAMFGAGMKAYTAEKKAEAAAELARQQRETDLALKMMEIRAQQEATQRDIAGKEFTQEKDLRGEFTKQSKDFDEALLGFEKVQKSALTKEPSGASDIALVFGFMKVLDPNSVVREGEFATAANAGGAWEVLGNTYNRLLRGELLSPPVRKKFVKQAREQFLPYLGKQEAREASFIGLAESYGLSADKVVSSRLPKMGSLARPYITMSEDEAKDLPKGSYAIINGRLAEID